MLAIDNNVQVYKVTMGTGSNKEKMFEKNCTNYQDQNIEVCICHMKGWRQYMEDASLHVENYPLKNHFLFGIFDGHGGAEVATYVERHFCLELFLNKDFKDKKYEQALIENFNKMDHLLMTETGRKELKQIHKELILKGNAKVLEFDEKGHAGATANVCFITEEEIYVANAGDSRCIICVDGKVVPMSFDHKPEDHLELKRITSAGGYVTAGRVNMSLNLSRSLGDFEFKTNEKLKASEQIITSTPDIMKHSRQKVSFILMGCDGIFQIKSNEELMEFVRQRIGVVSLESILKSLFEKLTAKDSESIFGTDNMSAILIKFKS